VLRLFEFGTCSPEAEGRLVNDPYREERLALTAGK
jgi:hypothetical protein